MTNSSSSRLLWVTLLLVVIVAAGVWSLRVKEDVPAQPGMGSVVAGQREAIDNILAICPVDFKVDEQGRVVQLVARSPEFTDHAAAQFAHLPDLASLQLEGSGIGSGAMEAIGRLEQLRSLRLDKTKITDADLQHLAARTGLRELFLPDCQVGDAGVASLAGLTGLQLLELSRTQVTDEGIKQLKKLSDLEKLYLAGTAVTGAGLAEFADPHGLTLLNLNEAPVTGEGIEALRRFTSLQLLYLDGVKLDDALVTQLMNVVTESFPEMNGLFLSETPLTDSAIDPLMALAELPNLSLVGLNGTAISKAAFQRLAEKTPETRYLVDYEPGNN